jgi:flagellar hook-length control protein FliK
VWMVRENVQEAKIRLDPPNLGPLEISVAVKDDRASILIHASHAITRDVLEAEAPRLRGMLGDNGFAAVDVNIARDNGRQQGGGERSDGVAGSRRDHGRI